MSIETSASSRELPARRDMARLFAASFAGLFFELLVIRYLSAEVRAFAYLKSVPLIASFFGLGLGMLERRTEFTRKFPQYFAFLFLLIAFSPLLGVNYAGFPQFDYMVFGSFQTAALAQVAVYYIAAATFIWLVVAFSRGLGSWVGTTLDEVPGLLGYGINLAGSLAGVLCFALLALLGTPPPVWLLVGIASLVPFFSGRSEAFLGMFAVSVLTALTSMQATWSQYYRIDQSTAPVIATWGKPSDIQLDVNHAFHQRMLDLSPAFLRANPGAQPNHSAALTYELPYLLVPHPQSVLVVGAGTGNDVAAALRHGAGHVDAVEIDRAIYRIGKRLHPEHPYANPAVGIHITDARSFFERAPPGRYDLIVFAYLDAHTLLSSYSSLRLDNFVYTVNSLRAARKLLREDGTFVLTFYSGRQFVDERIFAMVADAFDGTTPYVYAPGDDPFTRSYVEGAARRGPPIPGLAEQSGRYHVQGVLVPTDRWPFLYLTSRSVPVGVWTVLLIFLLAAGWWLRGAIGIGALRQPAMGHFFALGAAFLLLETKGVTQLSLLFGSTWQTNTVVIAGFLLMAMLANMVAALWEVWKPVAYLGLALTVVVDAVFPYSSLSPLGDAARVPMAAVLVGLPVFFSGLIFSASLRQAPDTTKALGANLLGATVGGALENLVMIGGTPLLSVLAFGLYVVAFAADRRRKAPAAD